jgi:hypothetical protein
LPRWINGQPSRSATTNTGSLPVPSPERGRPSLIFLRSGFPLANNLRRTRRLRWREREEKPATENLEKDTLVITASAGTPFYEVKISFVGGRSAPFVTFQARLPPVNGWPRAMPTRKR